MTSPEDLLSLATPYALHALTDREVDDIDRRLRDVSPDVADAFRTEVRAVRETMAVIAEATAVEPPAELRAQVLSQIGARKGATAQVRPFVNKRRRWTTVVLAAAAVVAVGLGALGVGVAMRPTASESTTDQIFAAPDVRTVSGDIPGGGTATLVFSRERDSGVLVMNNVTPPKPGTVYQMWLVASDGPHSAGTMDAGAVRPSTTAVLPDLGSSKSLAFTIEPPGGSKEPTAPAFAELPLT
ncbi:anti-sigma factor [Mycolicibacterium sp. 018/SC-01/001]|uniref:anti-sigma factor n=1 Tax=Mycolicibacterium sp. 018/SC-01/001 TaxID=2592069 RepID=UPI00117F3A8F|nr:anti-sigma factor [Mycolicibacterium sp. 018/SC-01/001]TRW82074.1 anti-sigma factor [Mycolicibacterium sp. 018/SC-01/001]